MWWTRRPAMVNGRTRRVTSALPRTLPRGVETDRVRIGLRVRRLVQRKVRDVVAGPLGPVPPHPLLALAPRSALHVRGRAIVEEAPVGRPRPAPLELRAGDAGRIGLLARGKVPVLRGEHAAVDPGGAGGRAVVLEVAEAGEVPIRLVGVVAVDVLEDLERIGLAPLPFAWIVRVEVPDQVAESLVTRLRRVGVHRLE